MDDPPPPEPPEPPEPPPEGGVKIVVYDLEGTEIPDGTRVYIADNSDDDNENDIMDKEENNVTCEDNVLETILHAWDGESVGGNVVLSRSTPGVRLWRNPRKVQSSDEVAFGTYTFEEFISTVADRYLWLEGCQPGATVLSLSFQGKTDDADITVYGVDLELHKP
ncbi:MAG: hypothetical protein GX573_26560, partial [Chloroflexi bacterium]|nr:hypothetical protein [Chloroflexota bacterium]